MRRASRRLQVAAVICLVAAGVLFDAPFVQAQSHARVLFESSDHVTLAVDSLDVTYGYSTARQGVPPDTLLRSFDRGRTWSEAFVFPPSSRILTVVSLPSNTLLAGVLESRYSVWRSTDFGLNWRRVFTFPRKEAGLFASQSAGADSAGTVFMSTYNVTGPASSAEVYRSKDDGTTWSLVHRENRGSARFTRVDPYGGNVYVGMAGRSPASARILRSEDGGDSWRTFLAGEAASAADIVFDKDYVYLGQYLARDATTLFRVRKADRSLEAVSELKGAAWSASTLPDGEMVLATVEGPVDGPFAYEEPTEFEAKGMLFDFEASGLSGWGPWGNAEVSLSTKQARSGSNSLAVSTGSGANEGTASAPENRLPASPGQEWSSSVWIFVSSAQILSVGVDFYSHSQAYITGSYKTLELRPGWQQVRVRGAAPSGAGWVAPLGVRSTSSNPISVYIDDMSIQRQPGERELRLLGSHDGGSWKTLLVRSVFENRDGYSRALIRGVYSTGEFALQTTGLGTLLVGQVYPRQNTDSEIAKLTILPSGLPGLLIPGDSLKASVGAQADDVVFLLDGEEIGAVKQSPYTLAWRPPKTHRPGDHVLTARARGPNGNTVAQISIAVSTVESFDSGSLPRKPSGVAVLVLVAGLSLAVTFVAFVVPYARRVLPDHDVPLIRWIGFDSTGRFLIMACGVSLFVMSLAALILTA